MAAVTKTWVWHDGMSNAVYDEVYDWVNDDIEVRLVSAVPGADVVHEDDLPAEETGLNYLPKLLTNKTSTPASATRATLTADPTTWPGLAVGVSEAAVLVHVSSGAVLGHLPLDAANDNGVSGKINWTLGTVTPDPTGWGAVSAKAGLGWSPSMGTAQTNMGTRITGWETYIGTPARALVVFAHAGLRNPDWTAQRSAIERVSDPAKTTFYDGGHNLILQLTIPMLLREGTGNNFDALLAGDHDAHWRGVGKDLHDNGRDVRYSDGRPSTVLRIAWEANGNWYPWFLGNSPSKYKACWRRIILLMRAGTTGTIDFTEGTVTGGNGIDQAGMDFEFNVNTQGNATRAQILEAWPDEATIASLDYYDYQVGAQYSGSARFPNPPYHQSNNDMKIGNVNPDDDTDSLYADKATCNFIYHHCKLKGIMYAISEWGLCYDPLEPAVTHVGGDNPLMIQDIYDHLEIAASEGFLAYHTYSDYFGDGEGDDSRIRAIDVDGGFAFPLAEAKFRELFGTGVYP